MQRHRQQTGSFLKDISACRMRPAPPDGTASKAWLKHDLPDVSAATSLHGKVAAVSLPTVASLPNCSGLAIAFRGGAGVGSVISSANLLSSVFSRRKKLETPPLPLPLRGGERLPPEGNRMYHLLNPALELSGYRRRACPDGTPLPSRGGERLPPEREPHVPSLEPCT